MGNAANHRSGHAGPHWSNELLIGMPLNSNLNLIRGFQILISDPIGAYCTKNDSANHTARAAVQMRMVEAEKMYDSK